MSLQSSFGIGKFGKVPEQWNWSKHRLFSNSDSSKVLVLCSATGYSEKHKHKVCEIEADRSRS